MSNPTIKTAESNDNLFSKLWFRYFPYWELFVVLLWVSLICAWFYLRYKIPVYESTTAILIKDEKKGLDDSKMLESLNLLATKKIIENEIEVLRSRSLMHEVVNKLHLYAPVFEEGTWVPNSAYNSSPIKILHNDPDLLEQTGKIYFTIDSTSEQIVVGKESFPFNQWVNTPYGMLKFARNATVTDFRNRRFYFSLINPRQVTQALTGSLNILPASKLSTVLYLKIRDQVPERGEDILDELVFVYNKAAINDKNSLAVNTLSFVEERLNFVAHDLDSIEREIQSYKSRKGAIDIGAQGRLFLQNVSDNDQKLGEVNMQLAVLDQIEAYLVSKDKQGGIVPSTLGINDPDAYKAARQTLHFRRCGKPWPSSRSASPTSSAAMSRGAITVLRRSSAGLAHDDKLGAVCRRRSRLGRLRRGADQRARGGRPDHAEAPTTSSVVDRLR